VESKAPEGGWVNWRDDNKEKDSKD